VLLGLVIYGLFPRFAVETVEAGEHYGAAFGLGVLVTFGLFIAALIACFTIVGLLLVYPLCFCGPWGCLAPSLSLAPSLANGCWAARANTAAGGAHGAGRTPGAHRHEHPVHRILAALAVVLWGMGAISWRIPPVAARGRTQYSIGANRAAGEPASAEYHCRRHVTCLSVRANSYQRKRARNSRARRLLRRRGKTMARARGLWPLGTDTLPANLDKGRELKLLLFRL